MNNTVKGILTAIPLVVALSGPAMAALGESMGNGVQNGTPVAIDSLLNRYSGVTPGQHGASETEDRLVPLSQQFSAFTNAGATMSSEYTAQGSERIVSASGNGTFEDSLASGRGISVNSEAASTSASLAVIARIGSGSDSPGGVAGAITPSSTSGGSGNQTAEALPADITLTTTIIPDNATPVPLPAAIVLFGSGLAALAPLRKRARMASMQVS